MTDNKVRPGRECRFCGEDSAEKMVRHRHLPGGLDKVCRSCNRARCAEYRDDNRDELRAYDRARRARWSSRSDAELAEDCAAAHPEGTKYCRGGHTAPVDAFPVARARHDGLNVYCRPCNNARRDERRNGRRIDYWADNSIPLRCIYCHGPNQHADHVIPLAGGGADELWALRPSCAACNWAKSDRPPLEWLATRLLPYSDELAAASITLSMVGELDEDVPTTWSTDWVEAALLP